MVRRGRSSPPLAFWSGADNNDREISDIHHQKCMTVWVNRHAECVKYHKY